MSEQKRFEVVIYNRIVRDLVERHESHKDLKDDWGDNHYQEIRASTADEARRRVDIRYPGHKGFVVASVTEVQAFDGED